MVILLFDYINYNKYIKSDKWKKLREKALIRDNFKCVDCGNKATSVHHKSYCILNGRELDYIISLCDLCHEINDIDKKKWEVGIMEAIEMVRRGNNLKKLREEKLNKKKIVKKTIFDYGSGNS
jgi:5-methylcytosine-specific restriction endonuclease McrA